MMPQADCPVIVLASGQALQMRKVMLYEEEGVNDGASLIARANKCLGGVSTGIGFWGSPGWVLGGTLALGLLENALSSSARKQGAQLYQMAQAKIAEVTRGGIYFETARLANVDAPYPESWYAQTEVSIDLRKKGWLERNTVLEKYKKTKRDVVDGQLRIERRFVHNGDAFVHIECDLGKTSVRWSNMVAYFPAQRTTLGSSKETMISGHMEVAGSIVPEAPLPAVL